MVAWNSARTKVQLKLAVQRTKMLQDKKQNMAKKERKEIAGLVERGKLEFARAKVEGCIAEDIYIELLEIMELYCETLISRFALLDLNSKEPDPAVVEPLCAIIHAAPRIELRELHVLREMLMSRYGRDFAVAAVDNKDGCVPERVSSRLKVQAPQPELVDMYINEICKAYHVAFTSPLLPSDEKEKPEGDVPSSPGDEGGGTKVAVAPTSSDKVGAASSTPSSTAAPAPSTTAPAAAGKGPAKSPEQQQLEDLEARFAALKRK